LSELARLRWIEHWKIERLADYFAVSPTAVKERLRTIKSNPLRYRLFQKPNSFRAKYNSCGKFHQVVLLIVNNGDFYMRTAKVISLSLPPEMEEEVQKVAKEEHRTISELLREAFRQYLTNRDLVAIRKEGHKVAKKMKLNADDIAKTVRASRK
jgi:Arc/MetJ-type ribon-helix-helix transcriptional regulator